MAPLETVTPAPLATDQISTTPSTAPPRLTLVADSVVWLFLAALVMFTVSRHEPWADEAQSWLLARDLGWFKLIFSELRFEGHPGLWHSILWVSIHVFHMPYAGIGYLGATFAIAGLAVLIFLAPFPRPMSYLVASSFFLLYQYAAVARSYVLLPLLAFLSAYFLRQGMRKLIWFAVALSLLAHVSVHGAVIAIALASLFLLQHYGQWPTLDSGDKRNVLAAAGLFAFSLVMLVIILFPPRAQTVAMADASSLTFSQHWQKAFGGLVGAVYNNTWLAAAILLLIGVWCYGRRGLSVFLIAVGGLTLIYGFLRGVQQHQGLMLIAILVALWSVWPTEQEKAAAPANFQILHSGLVTTLFLLFCLQTYWSACAMINDWRGPYCGAGDLAAYIKSTHLEDQCYAYNYWEVGVQPYFDHNIFPNLGDRNAPSFFHESEDFRENVGDLSAWKLRKADPPCVLHTAIVWDRGSMDRMNMFATYMNEKGYSLVHVSQGFTFYKDTPGENHVYALYRHR